MALSIPDHRSPIPDNWWATYFDAHYLLEYSPIFDLARDRREVARLLDILGLPAGSRILDVPCGQGRHAHLLAEAGFDVDGLDYLRELLAPRESRGTGKTPPVHARRHADASGKMDRTVRRGGQPLHLVRLLHRPSDDAARRRRVRGVLKPGGTLVWHGGNRDGVMARFLVPRLVGDSHDGTMIGHERSFDALSGVLTDPIDVAGPSFERRTRAPHSPLLRDASRRAVSRGTDLVVEAAYDGLDRARASRRSRRDAPRRAEGALAATTAQSPLLPAHGDH